MIPLTTPVLVGLAWGGVAGLATGFIAGQWATDTDAANRVEAAKEKVEAATERLATLNSGSLGDACGLLARCHGALTALHDANCTSTDCTLGTLITDIRTFANEDIRARAVSLDLAIDDLDAEADAIDDTDADKRATSGDASVLARLFGTFRGGILIGSSVFVLVAHAICWGGGQWP